MPLRLTAGLRVGQTLSEGLPSVQLCETYLPVIPHSVGRGVAVNPPLHVALQPSIDPYVRIVEPHQTVEAGGLPITLDRVVMTAAGTTLYLRLPYTHGCGRLETVGLIGYYSEGFQSSPSGDAGRKGT